MSGVSGLAGHVIRLCNPGQAVKRLPTVRKPSFEKNSLDFFATRPNRYEHERRPWKGGATTISNQEWLPRRPAAPQIREAGYCITPSLLRLGRLVEFLRSYRSAWFERRKGNTDAIFPCGTYLLRVAHGVPCAGFG